MNFECHTNITGTVFIYLFSFLYETQPLDYKSGAEDNLISDI